MSDQGTMNGAEWLARALAGTGMSHVFFVELVLRRTLLAFGRSRGEADPGAFGEGGGLYGRRLCPGRGRPGVCMAQSVGAANLASGLQDACLGRSPVIALTGHKEPSFQHRNSYQEIAHAPLVRGGDQVLDARSMRPSELPRLLRHAWRAALADPPRPTHLDFNGLQGDVIELGQTAEPPVIETEARPIPVHRPVADERDIERAAALLLGAARGSRSSPATAPPPRGPGPRCWRSPRRWPRRLPRRSGRAASSRRGTASSAGVAGSYSAPPANRIVCGADLVLFIGCDTGDQVTLNWRVPAIDTRIVQIDADPMEIGRSYPNTTGLVGDPKATLARLSTSSSAGRRAISALPRRRRGSSPIGAPAWPARREEHRADQRSSGSAPRSPARCRPDGILVADTGYSGIWTGTMIDFNGAGQSYQRAAGSLGWAFPASLGAQCAAGPRKVVCFTGDGGFYYHLAELETARRCNIPLDGHRQQQFRLRPEPDRGAPHLGQPAGPRRGADPLRADRFHRGRAELRRARHPGRAAAARSRRRCSRRSPPTSRSWSMSSPISSRALPKPGRRHGTSPWADGPRRPAECGRLRGPASPEPTRAPPRARRPRNWSADICADRDVLLREQRRRRSPSR